MQTIIRADTLHVAAQRVKHISNKVYLSLSWKLSMDFAFIISKLTAETEDCIDACHEKLSQKNESKICCMWRQIMDKPTQWVWYEKRLQGKQAKGIMGFVTSQRDQLLLPYSDIALTDEQFNQRDQLYSSSPICCCELHCTKHGTVDHNFLSGVMVLNSEPGPQLEWWKHR